MKCVRGNGECTHCLECLDDFGGITPVVHKKKRNKENNRETKEIYKNSARRKARKEKRIEYDY